MNNGAVELDSSIMGAQQDGKKIKVPLNSRFLQSLLDMFSHPLQQALYADSIKFYICWCSFVFSKWKYLFNSFDEVINYKTPFQDSVNLAE